MMDAGRQEKEEKYGKVQDKCVKEA